MGAKDHRWPSYHPLTCLWSECLVDPVQVRVRWSITCTLTYCSSVLGGDLFLLRLFVNAGPKVGPPPCGRWDSRHSCVTCVRCEGDVAGLSPSSPGRHQSPAGRVEAQFDSNFVCVLGDQLPALLRCPE